MNRQTDVRLSLWAVCPVRWCCYKRRNVVYSEDLEKLVHKKKAADGHLARKQGDRRHGE